MLNALERSEEPEPVDRTIAVLELTVDLKLPAKFIGVFEDTGSSSGQLQLDRVV